MAPLGGVHHHRGGNHGQWSEGIISRARRLKQLRGLALKYQYLVCSGGPFSEFF